MTLRLATYIKEPCQTFRQGSSILFSDFLGYLKRKTNTKYHRMAR